MAFNMSTNPSKDYYSVLNLSKHADRKEIRTAYHALALQYHPDKTGSDLVALSRFQEIQEAFDILGDPDTKSEYDLACTSTAFSQHDDEANGDQDIDQKVWDEWQAAWDGQKASSFSKPTGASYQGSYVGYSTQFEPPQSISTQTHLENFSSLGNSDKEGHSAASAGVKGGQGDAISISSDEDTSGLKDVGLSSSSPPSAKHWSYNDYFDLDHNEKPLLQEMRDSVESIKDRYRNSCKAADIARVDINYAKTAEERAQFEHTFAMRCDTRESYKNVKVNRERNLKAHERLAKDAMRLRKKQEKEDQAAAKKEAALLQKLRQHRRRRDETSSSGFGPYRVTKPRSAKRTSWYGADSGDESEGEWSANANWKP